MKRQDILLLLKLVSLRQSKASEDRYSVRALSAQTGISKSEVSNCLLRSVDSGLASVKQGSVPVADNRALAEFIPSGVKYVFPVRPGPLGAGVPTAFRAPGLNEKLVSTQNAQLVWPDEHGEVEGRLIAPLYKSAPYAARQDQRLYDYLALIDAIRLGSPREVQLATQLLRVRLKAI